MWERVDFEGLLVLKAYSHFIPINMFTDNRYFYFDPL